MLGARRRFPAIARVMAFSLLSGVSFLTLPTHAEYVKLGCRTGSGADDQVVLTFDVNREEAEIKKPGGDVIAAKLQAFPSVLRFSSTTNPLMPTINTFDVDRRDLSMVWVISVPEIRDKFPDVKTHFQCQKLKSGASDNLI